MNILLFVMSMLMIFVLMTYAKLDSYRSMSGVENAFTSYMEKIERSYINNTADQTYNKITFPKNSSPSQPRDPKAAEGKSTKKKSSGRLSLSPLLNRNLADQKTYEETLEILKKLIRNLYGRQPYFRALLKNRNSLVEDLIEKIQFAIEALPKDKKIKKPIDLSHLKLGDGLDEPLYLMLKGCPNPITKAKIQEISSKAEDNADDQAEAEEFTSDKSFDSLLNFIDLRQQPKINIYLASKELLKAIYTDSAIADKIIHARLELFRAVDRGEMTSDQASERLQAEFQTDSENSLFEYKVTGSDPRRYD